MPWTVEAGKPVRVEASLIPGTPEVEVRRTLSVGDVPDASVNVVLSWVGDDPELARLALDAEEARETPRSSLLAALHRLV